MARAAPTDEQSQLRRRARRRLVGAIALVTAVAVVLPWVLESEPRPPTEEVAIQIPSPDSGSFDPRTEPEQASAGEPAEPNASAATSAPDASDPLQAAQEKVLGVPAGGQDASGAGATDKAQSSSADKTRSASADRTQGATAARKESASADKSADKNTKPTPQPARKPEATAGRSEFVVQVAALADAGKARELRHELATRGLKVYTEQVKVATGAVTRVRVGPFPSREVAEKERERLKALGFEGDVAPR